MPLISSDALKVLRFWQRGEDPFALVKKHRRLWKKKSGALQKPRKAKT